MPLISKDSLVQQVIAKLMENQHRFTYKTSIKTEKEKLLVFGSAYNEINLANKAPAV